MGFFKRLFGKNPSDDENQKMLSEATETIEQLKRELAIAKQSQGDASEARNKEVETKYKALLQEANAQIKKLDEQLADSLNGKMDEVVKSQIAEAEALKKKMKDMEDELEEAQEDAEDFKKKWKKTQTEVQDLQDERDKLNSSNKELSCKLDKTIEELNTQKKELELKMSSLAFVQEVLNAPKANSEDLVKLYDKIDDVTDYINNDFYDCVKELYQRNDSWDYYFGIGLWYWDAVARKRWIQGKTTIAFVGEFSAGKTSIVNRVLSQDRPDVALLPTSAKATTAIPTYITGGPGNSYHFVSADNTLKNIKESTFKEVSKEILGQIEGVSSLITYFVMQYKNPFLDKISILDTPGFNSNDPKDAERTINVINECDALFWVVDVNAGTINRSSLQLIHKYLQKPLYVVINQIDTKSSSEVDKVEQLVKKHFVDEGIEVEGFVRFSKKEPLKVIMDAINSVPKNSNDDYLENLSSVFIPDLLNVYEEEVRKATAVCKETEKKTTSIEEQFRRIAKATSDKCYAAASIPKYTEHLNVKVFGRQIGKDDNYEMSVSDADRMINLLNQISGNEMRKIEDTFECYYEAAQAEQQAYADLAKDKYNYQRINECVTQLKKRIHEYEKVIGIR